MSPTALRVTAYHEAEHAIAAIVRRVRFAYVTIEPDAQRGAAGRVRFPGNSVQSMERLHGWAVVALAGDAAQRQFSPRSMRAHHSVDDREAVVDLARKATGSAEQATLLVKFWSVCARDLIASRWDAVNRVAAALLERKRLTQSEVLTVAMGAGNTFRERPISGG